jgi:DNA-binding CsgD family transcriptional regulator/GAF domain-containing protein
VLRAARNGEVPDVKPTTYDEALRRADDVLRCVTATFGLELPGLRSRRSDPDQAAQVLADARLALQAAAERTGLSQAAAVALTELSAAALDLAGWRVLRGQEAPRRLRRTLTRLRGATVDELVALIPAHAAELGYDRVLLSKVSHGRWIPCSAWTRDDPAEAKALVVAGSTPSCRATRELLEDQVVRGRTTILVRDAQSNPRVHAQLLAVTHSHTYVAAPLVLRGRVVGLVHVDRNSDTGTMDDFDRDLLELLAEGLSLTLERATALADLETVRGGVEAHAAVLHELMGRLGDDQDPLGGARGRATGGPACDPDANAYVAVTESFLHADAARRGPNRIFDSPAPAGPEAWRDELTRREEQVLRLVAEGLTNAQIAERLFVAEGTVKSHVKNVMRKLGVATRSEAGAVFHRGMSLVLVPARG